MVAVAVMCGESAIMSTERLKEKNKTDQVGTKR